MTVKSVVALTLLGLSSFSSAASVQERRSVDKFVTTHGPQHYGFEVESPIKNQRRQDNDRVVVRNLHEGQEGDLPARTEFYELKANSKLWDLTIQAWNRLQLKDQENALSYYQISGIHGVPHTPYSGVQALNSNTANLGYCTHVSILFPSWHRPYMSLLENSLYDIVQEIASEYDDSERDEYEKLAKTWRLTYWDWAASPPAGEDAVPTEFLVEEVAVHTPEGDRNVSNPFYSYKFHPLDGKVFNGPFATWNETMRYPSSQEANAESRSAEVTRAFTSQRSSLQNRLYNLFADYHRFDEFSNKAYNSSRASNRLESIESVHDTVHGIIGGDGVRSNGHMSYIPFSSFDPLFYLHHINVDRLIAMWQALNPDEWVTPYPNSMGTYTLAPGSIVDAKTPLTPFYRDEDGNFYDSDGVRETSTFGYTYKETADFAAGRNGRAEVEKLRTTINQLYGRNSIANQVVNNSGSNSNEGSASLAPIRGGSRGADRGRFLGLGRDRRGQGRGRGIGGRSTIVDGKTNDTTIVDGKTYNTTIVDVQTNVTDVVDDVVDEIKKTLTERPDFRQSLDLMGDALENIFQGGDSYTEWIANIQIRGGTIPGNSHIFFFIGDAPSSCSWNKAKNLVGSLNLYTMDTKSGMPGDAVDNVIGATIPLTSFLGKLVGDGLLTNLLDEMVQPFLLQFLQVRIHTSTGEIIDPMTLDGFKISISSAQVKPPSCQSEFPTWSELEERFQLL